MGVQPNVQLGSAAVPYSCRGLLDDFLWYLFCLHRDGSPKDLPTAQIVHLNELTLDLPEIDKAARSGSEGTVELTIPMNSNDIVFVKLRRSQEGN
jgi:hypothetical protein